MDDWQEMNTAPKNTPVLVCPNDCDIVIASQVEGDIYDSKTGKARRGFVWRIYKTAYYVNVKPQMWRLIPLPPKHLYERKLTADLLEKQVKELRGENS
jgi:hypothetical protein